MIVIKGSSAPHKRFCIICIWTAMALKHVRALRELVAHPSVDLDTRDVQGRSLEDLARWVQQQFIETFCFCCRDLGFGEGERIVNEARRRRRGEAGVQLQTNKQPAAPECPVCLFELRLLMLNFLNV